MIVDKANPSQDYKDLINSYKELHKNEGAFKGISLRPLVPTLHKIIKSNDCKTLLDYGCGKGCAYDDRHRELGLADTVQNLWDIDSYTLYDPAYPQFDKIPTGKHDIVLCTDVMEHIPEQDLDWVIQKIFNYANKAVFFSICTMEAIKTFQEGKFKGKNVHVTVQEKEWWLNKFSKIWGKQKTLKVYLHFTSKEGNFAICLKKRRDKDGTDSTDRSSDKIAG